MVRFFFLFLLAFVVSGWGSCYTTYTDLSSGGSGCYSCPSSADCSGCAGWGLLYCENPCYGRTNCIDLSNKYCRGSSLYADILICSNQTEIDSVNCLNSGNLWVNGSCCDEKCVCQNSGP